LNNEIDNYIRLKHVLLINIPIYDEIITIQNFRNFLIDYGDSVNFNLERWKKIIFMLYIEKIDIFYQNKQNNMKTENKSSNNNDYKVEKKQNGIFVLKIPAKFKTKNLLKFLRENVPLTNFDST
jgi:hypothetical protein